MTSDSVTYASVSAKLRRLKIQESILLANVTKSFRINSEENRTDIKYDDDLEIKKYFSKLKDSFREIKNLFEDITIKTKNQDYLETTDMNDLKRDILELDKKIRTIKEFLLDELQSLQSEEIVIIEKNFERSSDEKRDKDHSVPVKTYKEIVPSPVKAMMNSPFKCLEVQKFQDFIKSGSTRYGGWNEYNHNIFTQIWKKCYDDNMIFNLKAVNNTFSYQDFKDEVLHKIPGTTPDDIDSHSKWYSDYLVLKINQQKALDKWKENKAKIKRAIRKVPQIENGDTFDKLYNSEVNNKNNSSDLKRSDPLRHISDPKDSEKLNRTNVLLSSKSDDMGNNSSGAKNKIDVLKLMRPTQQWLNRQQKYIDTLESNKNIENISKLKIPTWRLNLNG